jgi:hypothetical protein
MFAVERMRAVTLTDHPYQLPLGFDLEAFVQDSLTVMRGRRIEAALRFDKVLQPGLKTASGIRLRKSRCSSAAG